MSVSLAAIALVAIFLPGYSFTLAYNKTYSNADPAFPEFSKITGRAVLSVVLACLFHAAAVPITNLLSDVRVDLDIVVLMISGTTDKEAVADILQSITNYPYRIFAYFLVLSAVAFVIGVAARKIVIRRRPQGDRFESAWADPHPVRNKAR